MKFSVSLVNRHVVAVLLLMSEAIVRRIFTPAENNISPPAVLIVIKTSSYISIHTFGGGKRADKNFSRVKSAPVEAASCHLPLSTWQLFFGISLKLLLT